MKTDPPGRSSALGIPWWIMVFEPPFAASQGPFGDLAPRAAVVLLQVLDQNLRPLSANALGHAPRLGHRWKNRKTTVWVWVCYSVAPIPNKIRYRKLPSPPSNKNTASIYIDVYIYI